MGLRAPRGRTGGIGGQVEALMLRGADRHIGDSGGSGEVEPSFGHAILVDAVLRRAGGWSAKKEARRSWGNSFPQSSS